MTDIMNSFFLQADSELIDEGIRFNSLPPNYVAWLLIPLGLIAFAWFFYKREQNAPMKARILLTALRVLAIFFVILLLFEPYRQFRRVDEIRSLVTVLVDGSSSMARKEDYEIEPDRAEALRSAANIDARTPLDTLSRRDLVVRAVGPDGLDLIEKIRAKHDVKIFQFSGGKPVPLSEVSEMTTEGGITATGDALAYALADPEVQTKPSASIVLISDGRANTGTNPVEVARYAGEKDRIPVHTIGVGDPAALRDIELRFVRGDEVALLGSTVKFELVIRNSGFPDDWSTITVKDESGRPWISPATRRIESVEGDQILEFDLVASRVGSFTLEVMVQGPAGEENVVNNAKKHGLVVKDDKIKVLYVDTLPRWEYRRLKNFLVRGDQSFEAQCLLLSAEPQFLQESSKGVTPLVEFPQTFKELDKYDVVIFGDVNPSLLVPTPSKLEAVLSNIQRFVDNGGGLAVISGEGWTPSAYVDTPLEELLPVDITFSGDGGFGTNYVDDWKPRLSAIGRQHPIIQLKKDPKENRRIWEERNYIPLKEMRWWMPVRKATPSSQVIAYHPTATNRFGAYPLLVAGSYGEGPVYFSAVDETWRWFYRSGPTYFNRYWGNVVRYLARAHLYRGSKRYKLLSNRSEYRQGQAVQLQAFVKDKNFEPASNEIQRAMIAPPGEKARMIELRKTEEGEYERTFKPSRFGRYEAWLVGDEGLAGKRYSPVAFEVLDIDPEKRNPSMNEEGLTAIAAASGGRYAPLGDSESLLERLKSDTTRRSKVNPRPLKTRTWLPLIFLGLLAAEWLIRRRVNLA